MITLDHIAVAGDTLQDAQAYVEESLGVKMASGGEHDVFFTHNKLLGLEQGLYLEAIAINPDAPKPTRARWFNLDQFSGDARLTNWICRTDALEASLSVLPEAMGDPVQLQRGDFKWQMAVPENGLLPFDNCAPALITWQTDLHPCDRLATAPVRLLRLTISHPQGSELKNMLSKLLVDDRVAFEVGAPGLHAEFATPHGPRVLAG